MIRRTGAVTTLLVKQLVEEKIDFSPMQATLFLAGIYEDTGNLTFPSTTAEDAKMAGLLLEHKADLSIIMSFLRHVYGPKHKEILFEMIQNTERLKINGYTISINNVNIDGHMPGLSLVVSMYQDIVNVDAAFGIFSGMKNNRCMVIGRSAIESIDIGSIMRNLGGGGHQNAGSAMLKAVVPDEVKGQIVELVKGNQPASVQIGDLMSFPVFSVSPELEMRDVALILREKGCTGIPVVENDAVVGIISRRDFKRAKKPSQMIGPVKAFMTRSVIHINPGRSVSQAAQLMVKNNIGRLPVIEDGKLVGIITRSDVMRYYYDLLPDEIPTYKPENDSNV